MSNRRAFLKFLAGSPLLAGVPGIAELLAQQRGGGAANPANQVLSVMDFEGLAKEALPPQHWGYLASGTDDDATVQANRNGFTRYQLRSRRLVDVSRIDMFIELFGTRWETPIALSPVGSSRAFHVDGELATARAAAARNTLQILSTQSTFSYEDVIAAYGAPIWFQLYTTATWAGTEHIVKRVEASGCPAIAVTVDTPAGRNTETQTRFQRISDTSTCNACHTPGPKPMLQGSPSTALVSPSLTWDFVKRLKDLTSMRVLLKGLETREDAELAVEFGADGIIVSNHGGRAGETFRGTIEALPEVVEGVRGRIPVLIDGGFRRGTDVFKALALGATAVCIGRPHIWGLSTYGQAGVERVLNILRAELQRAMGGNGTPTIKDIGPSSIIDLGRPA